MPSSIAEDTVGSIVPGTPSAAGTQPHFLSEAECHDIGARLARAAQGGGETMVTIVSTWRGNVRWARNLISTTGEDRNDHLAVARVMSGAENVTVEINETTDTALLAAVRRVERLARSGHETPDLAAITQQVPEPASTPALFSEATYQLAADQRADAAHQLAQMAAAAGMLSAGYLEVSAHSMAQITSWGYARYFHYTWAQYSVTVRDPTGTGSGWAGVDWPDWRQIDTPRLSALALDKCLRSRNPVAVEPGRYTTILEPQAVGDFLGPLMYGQWDPWPEFQALDLGFNTREHRFPFNERPVDSQAGGAGRPQLGERIVDERITIQTDPLDPELGFPPFKPFSGRYWQGELDQYVYHPVTWIDRGVLTTLAYRRGALPGQDTGMPLEGAFRMSVTSPTVSVAEMIATTQRGLLVTRLDAVTVVHLKSLSLRGYTRNGLWLIERGQLSKPVKNMRFTESILFALNSVEQLGVPQRVFHPVSSDWQELPQPVIVPPIKIRDFNFTALSGAV